MFCVDTNLSFDTLIVRSNFFLLFYVFSKGRPNQDAKYQEYRKSRKNEFNHDIKHMYQKKKKRKRFQLFGNFTKNYKFL